MWCVFVSVLKIGSNFVSMCVLCVRLCVFHTAVWRGVALYMACVLCVMQTHAAAGGERTYFQPTGESAKQEHDTVRTLQSLLGKKKNQC